MADTTLPARILASAAHSAASDREVERSEREGDDSPGKGILQRLLSSTAIIASSAHTRQEQALNRFLRASTHLGEFALSLLDYQCPELEIETLTNSIESEFGVTSALQISTFLERLKASISSLDDAYWSLTRAPAMELSRLLSTRLGQIELIDAISFERTPLGIIAYLSRADFSRYDRSLTPQAVQDESADALRGRLVIISSEDRWGRKVPLHELRSHRDRLLLSIFATLFRTEPDPLQIGNVLLQTRGKLHNRLATRCARENIQRLEHRIWRDEVSFFGTQSPDLVADSYLAELGEILLSFHGSLSFYLPRLEQATAKAYGAASHDFTDLLLSHIPVAIERHSLCTELKRAVECELISRATGLGILLLAEPNDTQHLYLALSLERKRYLNELGDKGRKGEEPPRRESFLTAPLPITSLLHSLWQVREQQGAALILSHLEILLPLASRRQRGKAVEELERWSATLAESSPLDGETADLVTRAIRAAQIDLPHHLFVSGLAASALRDKDERKKVLGTLLSQVPSRKEHWGAELIPVTLTDYTSKSDLEILLIILRSSMHLDQLREATLQITRLFKEYVYPPRRVLEVVPACMCAARVVAESDDHPAAPATMEVLIELYQYLWSKVGDPMISEVFEASEDARASRLRELVTYLPRFEPFFWQPEIVSASWAYDLHGNDADVLSSLIAKSGSVIVTKHCSERLTRHLEKGRIPPNQFLKIRDDLELALQCLASGREVLGEESLPQCLSILSRLYREITTRVRDQEIIP